ncbi:PIN domain-containing protein [Candidatus Pacearchaeota archaeon]|nr:PIN domain-containing protein [Candidatus Pacearchaeota archaeon]
MIGLDTTTIIDLFNGDKNLISVLENINEPLSTTIINYQEIVFGLNIFNKEHLAEYAKYNEFFNNLLVFPITKQSAKKASLVLWSLKKLGQEIDRFDCMIAGIFLEQGISSVITRNTKHFSVIRGLKVISY